MSVRRDRPVPRAPRLALHALVDYQSGRGRGRGVTEDISISGARICEVDRLACVGERLSLRFAFFMGSYSVPLLGEVVRKTEDGFAVRFVMLQRRHRELLLRALPSGFAV